MIANGLDDPSVADSPLVFPPAVDACAAYAATTTSRASTDHDEWTSIFDPIIQS